MSFITRFRGWLQRSIVRYKTGLRLWRRRQASKRQKAKLREFVYLDEVSVYSLIASRLGPIATEFTKTETASLKAEVGPVAGSVDSGSQVLRKSIVQTTFKELYELELASFVIRSIPENLAPPRKDRFNDIMSISETLMEDGWIVDPEKLARGQLMELEVQLEADDIFRVSTVISSILEIIEQNPAMFGLGSDGKIALVKSVGHILEKLLVGLVPITGQATEYEIVCVEGKEWIINRKLLTALPASELPPSRPLYVVGVAEQSLFWKDVRRILFSKARFRVLCRLAQNGIQDSWTPVKLAQVLDLVVPGLSTQIDMLGPQLLTSIVKATETNQAIDRKRLIHDALAGYAILLAKHYGHTISAEDLSDAGLPSEQQCHSFDSQKERREAFNEISKFVLQRFSIDREPMIVAEYRAVALMDAGLDLLGQPITFMASNDVTVATSSENRFLDSEFVAIYW